MWIHSLLRIDKMKLKKIVVAITLTCLANAGMANERDTSFEENRGALAGLVIGASAAGPIGAGVGAIVGGAIFGKLVGVNRINRELKVELEETGITYQLENEKLKTVLADVNQDLTRMVKIQANSWKHQQLPIQFRTDSSEIEKHYETELRKIARVLSRNQDAKVNLSGFADRRGADAYNQDLSEKRVTQVRQYLLSRGVRSKQIVASAFGESKPLNADESFEGNFFDRRVVLELTLDVDAQLATR